VNPNYKEIHGIACHSTIAAAGRDIDLALVAIPAKAVPGALEECAAAGVKKAVVIAAAGRRVLAELELNPVIAHADGSGLTVADALIRVV
jgi:acyl-CoA synthetase (NDP forming)